MDTARAFRITFVCTGNTCRSPLAEAVARRLVAELGIAAVEVESAGTHAWPGQPASDGAREVARAVGLDLDGHRSSVLTEERAAASDLLLCMTSSHVRHAETLGGAGRSRLLTEMAGEGGDVADPFGGPTEVYAAALAEIARLVRVVLAGAAASAKHEAAGGAPRTGPDGPESGDPPDAAGAARGQATFAVLGDPVAHSLSPAMHNAALRAAGIDARYVALRVSAEACGPTLRSLALAGGGGNVTLPHKERVLPFLDRRTAAVDATGACNTFWARDGAVWGDNTDVGGFRDVWFAATAEASLPRRFRWSGRGLSVLVLGAGGAARAVLCAVLESPRPGGGPAGQGGWGGWGEWIGRVVLGSRRRPDGPGRRRAAPGLSGVALWNRTPARAEAVVRHFADDRLAVAEEWRGLAPDVVVNATSVGMDGRASPIDLGQLASPPRAVVDLVYRAGSADIAPLGSQARELGTPFWDGREMLVRQAEAAYRRWFGRAPPKGVMSSALG